MNSSLDSAKNLETVTPIKLAILAVGGQGGGVLADWIVELAEQQGWWAQTTSVPGVAQRTGATIYYLELIAEAEVKRVGKPPVLAMSPMPGDVDIVIAAELMEAGRAMQRGLVTADRTTLIASSHRSLAIAEKAARGNGVVDGQAVLDAAQLAAKRFLYADLQAAAEESNSFISATLFGALAAAEVLPFPRSAFEQVLQKGKGASNSLRAFARGFAVVNETAPPAVPTLLPTGATAQSGHPVVQALLEQLRNDFPDAAKPMLFAGLCRLLDYQDVAYAQEYLARMKNLCEQDARYGGAAQHWAYTTACAQHLALAMCYDDVIRVADLKTRATRFHRIAGEVELQDGQLLQTLEFTHPSALEICGTLPAFLGRRLLASARFNRWVEKKFAKGRRIATHRLGGFLQLYCLAGMRRFRRSTLRHQIETAHREAWLSQVESTVAQDYALAVELVLCHSLIKGYSDTHHHGSSHFAEAMRLAQEWQGQPDAATRLAQRRQTMLAQ